MTRAITIVFVCVLTAALGLVHGHGVSITLDESTTLYWSYQVFHYDLSSLLQEIHTPSYDVLLGVWFLLSKFTLFWMRLFSTAMAVLAVGATYVFCRRYFNEGTAIFAALLLAFSPLNVFYSHYGRAYSFYIALSVLSSYCYLAFAKTPDRKNALLYLLSTYLFICSHIVGFALLAMQWAHFMIPRIRGRDSRGIRRWLALQAALGLLYSPILALILKRYNWVRDIPRIYYWVPKPTIGDLPGSFVFLSGASETIAWAFFGLAVALVLALTLPARGSGTAARAKPDSASVSYLFLWLCGPMLILFVYSYIHHPVFLMRGFAPSAVPWVIIAALALNHLTRIRAAQWAALACLLAASNVSLWQNRFGDHEDWSRAVQAVRSYPGGAGAAHDRIFLVRPKYAVGPFAYYMDSDCFFSKRPRGGALWDSGCLKKDGIYAVNLPEEVDAALKVGAPEIRFIGYVVERQANEYIVRRMKQNPSLRFLDETTQFGGLVVSSFSNASTVNAVVNAADRQ